jgi:GTP-binding protein HflX
VRPATTPRPSRETALATADHDRPGSSPRPTRPRPATDDASLEAFADDDRRWFDGDDATDLDLDTDADADLTRAELRRRRRDIIEEGAPREGVEIIRPVERAVMVGVQLPGEADDTVRAGLDELEALLETAGAAVVDRVVQRRGTPDVATFIGRGKADALREHAAALDADAVVFDHDLSPAQQRNLEEAIRQKVLDRTIVILDIFAQHASSREGKAQVELAQLGYLLPRLRGWGQALSRQAGGRAAGGVGIGGRGPGETQLEVDRRRIMRRITKLRRDLSHYERIRRTKSQDRERRDVLTVAMVGYTNAGKSSLLNRLTGSDVLVQDRLFATLDPTVRRLDLPDGRDTVVTDTVGFVRKLPHGLVEAFKSTLEESAAADLLVHVVDAAHPDAEAQIVAVDEVLAEIGADEVPRLVALNKVDVADPDDVKALQRHITHHTGQPAVPVSARTGAGSQDLVAAIGVHLPGRRLRVRAHVPYVEQAMVALCHERGDVHDERHDETGTLVDATVDEAVARRLRPWLDPDPFATEDEPWEVG